MRSNKSAPMRISECDIRGRSALGTMYHPQIKFEPFDTTYRLSHRSGEP
jgi:hypothetical protein